MYALKAQRGGEGMLHSFLTSGLEGGGGQRIALAALPTERDPLPTVEEAFWVPGRSGLFWRRENPLLPPGFKPWTVQLVESGCSH